MCGGQGNSIGQQLWSQPKAYELSGNICLEGWPQIYTSVPVAADMAWLFAHGEPQYACTVPYMVGGGFIESQGTVFPKEWYASFCNL